MHSLFVHVDASVRGPLYEKYGLGASTVGCVGWVGEKTGKPAISAEVTLEGLHAPQRAEFHAVTVGLGNALAYVAKTPSSVTHVLVYSDNKTVVNVLNNRYEARVLRPQRNEAREIQGWLEHYGLEVHYEYISRADRAHMQAHQRADQARRKLPRHRQ